MEFSFEALSNVQGVGAIILENNRNPSEDHKNDISDLKILLGKRKPDVIYPGWFFPCGTVEEGESPEMAIIREMNEELDITIKVIDIANWRINENNAFEIIYLCEIESGDLKLLDHEDT